MLESLNHIDHQLFYMINGAWSNALFDGILPFWRNRFFWAPVYLFLVSFFVINYKKQGILILIFAVLTILFCDQISSGWIKPFFQRPRPCHILEAPHINLLVECGVGFSYTSTHAANHFGLAVFLMMLFKGVLFRRWAGVLLFWAASVSFAQVYVGVHYPFDVLSGAVLGSCIGVLMGWLCNRLLRRLFVERYEGI